MSTATLSNLLEYLYATLTPNNMKWLGEHLIERAEKEEEIPVYTREELIQMAELGRKQIEDGHFFTTEEVLAACEKEEMVLS